MAGYPKGINKKGESPVKQPRPGIPLDKSTIISLLLEEHGNLSRVADRMGCSRNALRTRIESDVEMKETLDESRVRLIEKLEHNVWMDAIETRDTALRCFILKTQGRTRGWDQDEAKNHAKDIANAAFEFIVSKTKASN